MDLPFIFKRNAFRSKSLLLFLCRSWLSLPLFLLSLSLFSLSVCLSVCLLLVLSLSLTFFLSRSLVRSLPPLRLLFLAPYPSFSLSIFRPRLKSSRRAMSLSIFAFQLWCEENTTLSERFHPKRQLRHSHAKN